MLLQIKFATNMKKTISISTLFLLLICLISCNEEPVGQTPTDSVPPGIIKNPVVKNLPGAAIIKYDLPDDDDLLGVKAVYTLHGQEKFTTATMYTNSLKVEGFGSTDEQPVFLYTVDRSFNESEPVKVMVQPQTPPVQTIYETITIQTDFGGIQLQWENENKADISIHILAADSIGELSEADVVYTNFKEGKFSTRGFDDTERLFAVYVQDRWNNYSDTIQGLFTPLFEMELEKSKWKKQTLLGDNNTALGAWPFQNIFDGVIGDQGWHTSDANVGNGENGGTWPIRFTIDLGVVAKLSRYKIWGREGFEYFHHNPRKWKVYGTVSPRFDIALDEDYWKEGGYKEDWVFLGNAEMIKPSGEGEITNEDREYARAGFEFDIPLDAPPVRYLRFEVDQTWAGSGDLHFSEITCWGQLTE